MTKAENLFVKKSNARKLKAFPELSALGISGGASLIIAAIIFMGSKSAGAILFAALFAVPCILSFVLQAIAKRSIISSGEIPTYLRRLGYLLIPFGLCGNIFAAIAGFSIVKKERTVEYNLLYYAFLNNLFIIVVSALNLFKPAVSPLFWIGIAIIAVTLVIYLAAMLMLIKNQSKNYKSLKLIAIITLLTALTGNLFALIFGMVILVKIRHAGNSRTIEWVDTIRRIFRNYMSSLGMFIIIFLITLSICSYFTFDYNLAIANDYSSLMQAPSLRFPFGSDNLGRCVFTRIVFGARISLMIGMVSTAVPLLIGGLLGAVAGNYSSKFDNAIMRVLDVLYAVPSTLLTIAIVAAFGANTLNLIVALSISNIPIYARTMRAQVMVVSQNEFVEAARACGRRKRETLLYHIIPNSLAPMIVRASVSIGIAVLSTSSLSYLGLGVEPHIPEWGNILKIGSAYLETNPYLAIYPGIFIVVLVLAFNFLGDGLRDALDPKLK